MRGLSSSINIAQVEAAIYQIIESHSIQTISFLKFT